HTHDLHDALPIYRASQPKISSSAKIGQRAAARDEFLAHLLVPAIQLQAVACAEPVVSPGLRALPFPPNPTANQISIVGVTVPVAIIEVIKAVTQVAAERVVGVDAFYAKIHFATSRDLRHVKTAGPSRPVRVGNRIKLIIRITVGVER